MKCNAALFVRKGPDKDYKYPPVTEVRLSSGSKGRLEVKYNGTWGSVCSEGWDQNDAKVVCRQLGYSTVDIVKYTGNKKGPEKIWISGAQCKGTELSIGECFMEKLWGENTCEHRSDVFMQCSG